MKKILFLGGAPTQIPPLKYAREQGYYVITLDYLPDNPGHQLADKYYNISTIDKEAVLKVAQEENIDGIVAYASDPAAPTAAYVAEKMGLPGNPYESVKILARKDLFRKFLDKHNFLVPRSKAFYDESEAKTWLDEIGIPVFVKPVDSSGSKGVTRLQNGENFHSAFEHALKFSHEKKVVVEEAVLREGYQIDSDIFMCDGKIVFFTWGDQHQDKECHPYAPVAISYPSVLSQDIQDKAKNLVESILSKLNFKSGAFNVEFIVDFRDDIWIIEIGPRNGGNLIPDVIRYATGVDMIAATVDAALDVKEMEIKQGAVVGCWSSYVIHSKKNGLLKRIEFSKKMISYIVEQDIQVLPGTEVSVFNGSHNTLGTLILKYPSQQEMLKFLENIDDEITVIVE